MAAAQTKEHEEGKHTKMQGKNDKRRKKKKKSRKQGKTTSEQENRIQGVSIATSLPVSATKPKRKPCHTICHHPALVDNDIKCHCCRCRPPPPRTNQLEPNKTALTRGLQQLKFHLLVEPVPLISRTGILPHDLPFHFCIRRQQYQYGCPSLSPPTSLVITLGGFCCVAYHVVSVIFFTKTPRSHRSVRHLVTAVSISHFSACAGSARSTITPHFILSTHFILSIHSVEKMTIHIRCCCFCCCLHIQPFFLHNICSTPSVLPDSSSQIHNLCGHRELKQKKTKRR